MLGWGHAFVLPLLVIRMKNEQIMFKYFAKVNHAEEKKCV